MSFRRAQVVLVVCAALTVVRLLLASPGDDGRRALGPVVQPTVGPVVQPTAARLAETETARAPVVVDAPASPAYDPPNPPARSQYAYVTLLGSDNYLPGAQAMLASLRRTETPHDLVVLHLATAAPAALRALHGFGVRTVEVAYVDNPTPEAVFRSHRWASRRYLVTYTKFRAWQLTEYAKVVIIDNDMLVLRNIDELFEEATPGAAVFRKIVNPSLLVITPSEDEFERMVARTADIKSSDGGELGFLEAYWGTEFNHLRLRYNTYFTHVMDARHVKAVHMTSTVGGEVEKAWLRFPLSKEQGLASGLMGMGLQQGDEATQETRFNNRMAMLAQFWDDYTRFWAALPPEWGPLWQRVALPGVWRTADGAMVRLRQSGSRAFWAVHGVGGTGIVEIGAGTLVEDVLFAERQPLQPGGGGRRLAVLRLAARADGAVALDAVWGAAAQPMVQEGQAQPGPDPVHPETDLDGEWVTGSCERVWIQSSESRLFVTVGARLAGFFVRSHAPVIHGTRLVGALVDTEHGSRYAVVGRLLDSGDIAVDSDEGVEPVPGVGTVWSRARDGCTGGAAAAAAAADGGPVGSAPRVPEPPIAVGGIYRGKIRCIEAKPHTHRVESVVEVRQFGSRVYLMERPAASGPFAGFGSFGIGEFVQNRYLVQWFEVVDSAPSWWENWTLDREPFELYIFQPTIQLRPGACILQRTEEWPAETAADLDLAQIDGTWDIDGGARCEVGAVGARCEAQGRIWHGSVDAADDGAVFVDWVGSGAMAALERQPGGRTLVSRVAAGTLPQALAGTWTRV